MERMKRSEFAYQYSEQAARCADGYGTLWAPEETAVAQEIRFVLETREIVSIGPPIFAMCLARDLPIEDCQPTIDAIVNRYNAVKE